VLLLDTNHLDVLRNENDAQHKILLSRLSATNRAVCVSIVTVQEQLIGWSEAVKHASGDPSRLILLYSKLERTIYFYSKWNVLSFDDCAAEKYRQLRKLRLTGPNTHDLQIAAIAICNGATVLTRDMVHFNKIPELVAQDWLLDEPSNTDPNP
jgi:tRNA(fMet)-specific endonuclease VapC